jgi:hypothetical protein
MQAQGASKIDVPLARGEWQLKGGIIA